MVSVSQPGIRTKARSAKREFARFKPLVHSPKGKSRAGSAHHDYDFAASVSGGNLHADSMVAELIATPAFRRLAEVRFLGGIDYLLIPTPNGSEGFTRYTRYQHSLGVAWLAMIYAFERRLTIRERRLVLAAALLHDIGHCPLSHTLEPVFAELFNLGHHDVTERLIRGKFELGADLAPILQKHGVDIDELIRLMSGQDPSFDQLFSGPINFDTIEGILRSWIYVQYERRFPAPDSVLLSAIRRRVPADQHAIDAFWSYKDRVYRYLVRSSRGVIADHLCQQALRADIDRIRPQDFLCTERELFAKCPTLGTLVRSSLRWPNLERAIQEPIAYQARHFFIDDRGDFFARQDALRYKQVKEPRLISAEEADVRAANFKDLFHAQRL